MGRNPYYSNITVAENARSKSPKIVSRMDTIMPLPPVPSLCGNQTSVDNSKRLYVGISESTLSIARRVPLLLASNISGTLSKRTAELRSLFAEISNQQHETDEALFRVLKRCPELLLYNIQETIAPKLYHLDVSLC